VREATKESRAYRPCNQQSHTFVASPCERPWRTEGNAQHPGYLGRSSTEGFTESEKECESLAPGAPLSAGCPRWFVCCLRPCLPGGHPPSLSIMPPPRHPSKGRTWRLWSALLRVVGVVSAGHLQRAIFRVSAREPATVNSPNARWPRSRESRPPTPGRL